MVVKLNKYDKLVFMVTEDKVDQFYEIHVKGADDVVLNKLGKLDRRGDDEPRHQG